MAPQTLTLRIKQIPTLKMRQMPLHREMKRTKITKHLVMMEMKIILLILRLQGSKQVMKIKHRRRELKSKITLNNKNQTPHIGKMIKIIMLFNH